MIVFDLQCRPLGHRFEGWFGSSADFGAQQARGLVVCPHCGSPQVEKALMAPNVARKGSQGGAAPDRNLPVAHSTSLPPEAQQALAMLAQAQAEALKHSRWVGGDFAEQSRAIHYGERADEPIHGRATPEEARGLLDEGIAVMPLLVPVAPPDEIN
jgi:hypothetical protein